MPDTKERERKKREALERESDIALGHNMPDICPYCHDAYSLIFVEEDCDNMTEGQLAEYTAGNFGTAFCTTCKEEFDLEV